jgi:hypothetical protein
LKRDWKKDRAAGARHARLIAKRPELREALYGNPTPEERQLAQDLVNAAARETAKKDETSWPPHNSK